ncbi:hypothetical protein COHA_005391 [Chlorella ohadii]|uniref:Uncharacterized protein n=1 Tax=Chlorella ohadii TaxID=2649997 RepID=A0AAD5DRI3_9CHLO|nr:hypothetical protein COHA_005391 [Chlorella ohadii]
MATGGPSITERLKQAFGLPSQTSPKPIKVPDHHGLQRQDSFPEICSTPSEVGIFEVAHNKSLGPDGKFSWKKFFFEAPGRSSSGPTDMSGTAASSAAAAGGKQ